MNYPALARYLKEHSRPVAVRRAMRASGVEIGTKTTEQWFIGHCAPHSRFIGPLAEALGVEVGELLAHIQK